MKKKIIIKINTSAKQTTNIINSIHTNKYVNFLKKYALITVTYISIYYVNKYTYILHIRNER